jgi:hypothetical protein
VELVEVAGPEVAGPVVVAEVVGGPVVCPELVEGPLVLEVVVVVAGGGGGGRLPVALRTWTWSVFTCMKKNAMIMKLRVKKSISSI